MAATHRSQDAALLVIWLTYLKFKKSRPVDKQKKYPKCLAFKQRDITLYGGVWLKI